MREQLLNDEARRDDAHGAVELPPPPLSDHGAGSAAAQVALNPEAPNPGSGGLPAVVYHTRIAPQPGIAPGARIGGTTDLGSALNTQAAVRAGYAGPQRLIKLVGNEQ